jgi:hypothetical protein
VIASGTIAQARRTLEMVGINALISLAWRGRRGPIRAA